MCFQTRELSYPTALQTCFTHSTFHKCSQGPPLTFCTAQQHLMQISTTEIFPFCAMHGILASTSQGSAFHSFPGQGWHNTLIETVLSQHGAAGLKTSAETLQRCTFLPQSRQAITRNHITNFIRYF